jgi:alkylation response protein AidB-like acyl-CoA dehydrogenase
MSEPGFVQAACDLERYLGSPFSPQAPLSFARSIDFDEREALPDASLAAVAGWGLHRYHVPVDQGGALASFDQLLALTRAVSRRDLTVAIAHGQTFLGSAPIWIGGQASQQRRLAGRVMDRAVAALALTERTHGSDLLAGDTVATQVDGGYRLSGEKWLINNGTRADILTVFARSAVIKGPRGYSLFLVERSRIDRARCAALPKVRTLGIRGADISGFRLDDCALADDDLVGEQERGLDLVLKAFQITRPLCAGFSLGAGDTALRSTTRFALGRKLYGSTVFAIPHARQTLVAAFIDHFIADCVANVCVRGLHHRPDELSVWSAIVKYFVPTMIEASLQRLAVVLGARYYLRQEHDAGIFQKMLRDSAVVSLFDGSTVVNLSALAAQLGQITQRRYRPDPIAEERRASELDAICALREPVAAFAPLRLELHARGIETVGQTADRLRERLAALAPSDRDSAEDHAAAMVLLGRILEDGRALEGAFREPASGRASMSAELFEACAAYCRFFAALVAVNVWLANRTALGDFFARGEWLVLALNRLTTRPIELAAGLEDRVAEEVRRRCEASESFGIVPIALPG